MLLTFVIRISSLSRAMARAPEAMYGLSRFLEVSSGERPVLSGPGRKFDDVCGEEFSAQARRERRAYPARGSVRSEQRRQTPQIALARRVAGILALADVARRSQIAVDMLTPCALASTKIASHAEHHSFGIGSQSYLKCRFPNA